MDRTSFNFAVGFFFLGALTCGTAFFEFVDTVVVEPNELEPDVLLLEETTGPRILIDSGSNSLWNIDPNVMSAKLKMPTMIIADWAGIPFNFKLARLKKFAKAGDIVVLPLEWGYYKKQEDCSDTLARRIIGIYKFTEDATANFLHNQAYNFRFYYDSLSAFQRISFSLTCVSLDHLREWFSSYKVAESFAKPTKLLALRDRIENPYGGSKNDKNRTKNVNGSTCANYVAAVPLKSTTELDRVASGLERLQERNSIKIIITWPAVAGSNCYQEEELSALTSQIRASMAAHSIRVIGVPRPDAFSEGHMLDTYYHIDSSAAARRSEILADEILKAGILEDQRSNVEVVSKIRKVFSDHAFSLENEITKQSLKPLQIGQYAANDSNFQEYFWLASGWLPKDARGFWSSGAISSILLRSCAPCEIRFFWEDNNESHSKITFNGEDYLSGDTIELTEEGAIRINFEHSHVQSVNKVSASPDNWKPKMLLSKITISRR